MDESGEFAAADEAKSALHRLSAQADGLTQERAHRVLAGSGAAFWERHLLTGASWYSPNFLEVLGLGDLAEAGIAGDSDAVRGRIHPDDLDAFMAADAAARQRVGRTVHDLRFLHRDGDYRWVRVEASVWPDAQGRPETMVGLVHSVHAERRALASLEHMADRFDRAQEAASGAHFESVYGDAPEFFMSDRLCAMLGHPKGTPAPTLEQYLSWVHPDDMETLSSEIRLMRETAGAWQRDYRLRQYDGSYRWVRGRGRSMPEASGSMRVTGMVLDIDEQMQSRLELERHRHNLEALVSERTAEIETALAEAQRQRLQAERANEAKSVFLAHMSHEIRTPLNGVLGLNELLLQQAPNEQQRRYLTLALQSGRNLLGVISDVLDFSRLTLDPATPAHAEFDLAESLVETFRSVMPALRGKQLGAMYDYIGDIVKVIGDRQRVLQIATNLLSNAAKYTEHGHIEIVAAVVANGPGRCLARIAFRDTGPGMEPEIAARVFLPFVQGDSSLARRHGGTGLGLSIASGLAGLLGGSLTLETTPGTGSCFRLELPFEYDPAAQPAAPAGHPGHAWLVYTKLAPAQWLVRRFDRHGWQSDIVAGFGALLARADTATEPPELIVLAETALPTDADLAGLRLRFPDTKIVLLVRPDWNAPELEAEARAAAMSLAFMPLSPQGLSDLLTRRPAGAARIDSSFGALPGLPETGRDVLVVEDNPVNQIIICEMVASLGLRSRLAEEGAAAIAKCREQAPGVVLMDLQMPGVDGLEATRRLRRMQHAGTLAEFPIIALTAHATPQDRADCMAAGMADYLTKPVTLNELRQMLARWVVF